MEQLSTLFKDLQTMKQDISSLPTDEKFKQAEKVVKTFWRAMHGDSDEFSESKLEKNMNDFTILFNEHQLIQKFLQVMMKHEYSSTIG